MAARYTSGTGRKSHNVQKSASRQSYVYGNVVTKPAYEPRRRMPEPEQPKKISRQVRRNRKNALRMSPGYVMFLAAAALLALVVCVNYVQVQSRITSRSKNISQMQKDLSQMKEENNTRYNAAMDSVNLDEVRDKAMNNLGMVYASPDQVVEYENPASDYVKMYESIPEDGVLARSDSKK